MTRSMAFAADQYSVDNGYGAYLHSGLIAVHVNNSGCLNPDWLYETVHYTHPSLIERLKAIEKRMSRLVKRKTGQVPGTVEEVLEQYSEQVREDLARKHPEAVPAQAPGEPEHVEHEGGESKVANGHCEKRNGVATNGHSKPKISNKKVAMGLEKGQEKQPLLQ